MTKKKSPKTKVMSPVKPLPLPLPRDAAVKKPKKKATVKPSRFYVFEANHNTDVEDFDSLAGALAYINDSVLAYYEGETPRDHELVLIQGERIHLDYDVQVIASKA